MEAMDKNEPMLPEDVTRPCCSISSLLIASAVAAFFFLTLRRSLSMTLKDLSVISLLDLLWDTLGLNASLCSW